MFGPAKLEPFDRDQFVTLGDVTWSQYESVLAIRGDSPGVRLCYVEGVLQFMSPSRSHEGLSACVGRLFEAWSQFEGVDADAVGSWTVRRQDAKRGTEPDQCYVRGEYQGETRPDLAIEVVWTSGDLDKLRVWAGLEVPEVWIWQDGLLTVHCLDGGQYRASERSRVFPELDVALLAQFVTPTGQSRAVRAYLAALRDRSLETGVLESAAGSLVSSADRAGACSDPHRRRRFSPCALH